MDQAPFDTASNLKTEIIDLCGRMHGAEYRLLHRIRRLDEIEDWTAAMPSCAHWLVWRCGMDIVTAREKVRVAHALAALPLLDERFRG
ncbi:MAG: HNH endonuclease, partial [Gammaproteobacteria bacterium]|nr:HNH endonuclease [Gammaproteobacteria bacterium]